MFWILRSTTDLGPLGSSDHSVIKLEINCSDVSNYSDELIRDWRRGDEAGLISFINEVNFNEVFQGKNVSEC